MSPARRPVVDRILSRVVKHDDCWIWTGALRPGGYGVIGTGRGKELDSPHRLMYAAVNGPIPDGLHIDHLCRNRACCNPAHLEAVTQQENNRRANELRWSTWTHCSRGHALVAGNLLNSPRRICKTCHTLRRTARRRGLSVRDLLALGWGVDDLG